MLSRGLLELGSPPPAARVAIALLPAPFFVWYLWTWMKGVSEMDELERRIELEALGFAFPAAVVFSMTIGLLDVAIELEPRRLQPAPHVVDDADALLHRPVARAAALPVKNRLKVLRAERDWSQQDLADELGVSRQTINAIETEKYDPSLPLALKMGGCSNSASRRFSLLTTTGSDSRSGNDSLSGRVSSRDVFPSGSVPDRCWCPQ